MAELSRSEATCVAHCCKAHGCKYGEDDCPVEAGRLSQEYPCEQCTWALEDAGRYKAGEVGTSLVIGYAREDGTCEDLPDPEAVEAVVRAALLQLSLDPSWRITFVHG